MPKGGSGLSDPDNSNFSLQEHEGKGRHVKTKKIVFGITHFCAYRAG